MVDLVKALNQDKPKPLAKKSKELGIPQPTMASLAQPVADTEKSAQMAASPQAQKAVQQQSMRQAQVQSQAPREVATGEQGALERAQNSINAAAAVQTADFGKAQEWNASKTQINPATGQPVTGDALAASISDGTVTAETIAQDASTAKDEFLSGDAFSDSLTMTVGELAAYTADGAPGAADEGMKEILSYAQSLGLGPDASLSEIKQAVDNEVAQATAIVDNQREIMSDPNATPAERQAAAQNMKDYGAAHLIATDAQLDDFVNDISNVGVIEIDGQTMTLEDLQDNEGIMSMIAVAADEYLEDPNSVPDWAQDYPGLWDTVTKNYEAITSTMNDNLTNFKETKKVVDGNRAVTEHLGDDLSKALGVDLPTGTPISETYPNISILMPENEAALLTESGLKPDQVKGAIGYLSQLDPEFTKAWLKGDTDLEITDLVERAANLNAFDAGNWKVASGVTVARIQELMNDSQKNPQDYSPEQLKAIAYYNDPGNLHDKIKKDLLEGKEIPKIDDAKTGQEQQTDVAMEINDSIKFDSADPIDVLNARQGLAKLKEIENPSDTVLNTIDKLQKFQRKAAEELQGKKDREESARESRQNRIKEYQKAQEDEFNTKQEKLDSSLNRVGSLRTKDKWTQDDKTDAITLLTISGYNIETGSTEEDLRKKLANLGSGLRAEKERNVNTKGYVKLK